MFTDSIPRVNREALELNLAPDKRSPVNQAKVDKHDFALQNVNRHGSIPRFYEPGTSWIEVECGRCHNLFWFCGGASQARSCRQAGKECKGMVRDSKIGAGPGSPQLDLKGKRFGSLEVTEHERGKGWKVECDCGRSRFLLNSTALARGIYKTCGQCSEQERQERREAQKAQGRGRGGAGSDLDGRCEAGHPPVAFESLESGECPMCEAVKVMGELRATVVKLKTRIDRLKEGKRN